MKRLTFLATALASLFLAGSCQQQENLEPAAEGTSVSFDVEVPGDMETKAVADGKNVDVLYYAIYKDGDGKESHENGVLNPNSTPLASGYIERTDLKKFNITFDLLVDQEYVAIFWAQVGVDKKYYAWPENDDLRVIKYADSKGVIGNMEERAAFFRTYQFSTYQVADHDVTLYRPFAQLNLGSTLGSLEPTQGGEETEDYVIDVLTSEVKVTGLAKSFNTIAGLGVDEYCGQAEAPSTDTYIFKMHEVITSGTITDGHDGREYLVVKNKEGKDIPYEYIAMNYFFANGNVTVEYDIVTDKGTVNNTVENVPVMENFRTNIIGNLLTSKTEFEIVVDETFLAPDKVVSMWDGTMEEPKFDATTNTYEIGSSAELAWFAAAVNGTLPESPETNAVPAPCTFEGKTVKLIADIDLQNAKWTPIGYWKTFEGTFDGADHTIHNLSVTATEADCYLGLFGCTNNATIKNVKINNAKIKATVGDNSWAGGHLGALVGYPDGTTVIENVALTGDIKVEGPMDKKGAQRIGAVVGGFKATSLTLNNITVKASKGSYVKGNLYVGGVVGQPICPITMTNVVSNIDVYSQDGMVGGIAGYVMPNSTLTNCSFTGNVYRVASTGTENQVKRIGGILGSWESKYGKVVLDECEFEGTLYNAGSEYTDYLYGGLVGRAATTTEDATGVLIINGLTYANEHFAVDAMGNVYVYSLEGLQNALNVAEEGTTSIFIEKDIEGDATLVQKPDVKVVINGNNKNYKGMITVDGKSATYTTAGLTINNLTFNAESINGDACIRLGNGTDATRYTCNVTVNNCTFDVRGAVGVKSYTGGDKNLKLSGCTATAAAHSLLQVAGVDEVLVEGCTIKSKNGMNFNNSVKVTINECNADVKGYAARFGAGSTADAAAETYTITNSTLKSACEDGDAVIILRGTAAFASLYLENTTLEGANLITNNANGAKVHIDGEEYKTANSNESLKSALAGESKVILASGDYTLPSVKDGNVTINGTKDVVITINKPNYSGSDLTVNGVTVKGSGYATGVQHVNTVTYNDVKVIGEMCLYGEKVVFNNCEFELGNGQYIWTYGAKEVEFINCTFNTSGKAILVYNEGAGASNVKVEGCTFNATAGAKAGAIANQNCAAIEIDNFQNNGVGAAHVVTTSDNTYNNEYFSGEWRIKNFVTGNAITVNNTEYRQIAVDGKLMTIDADKNVTVNE